MRDAEELPAILAELEDAWRIVERSLYVFVRLIMDPCLDLTSFEAKSSHQPSKHLSNICRIIVPPSKTLRN